MQVCSVGSTLCDIADPSRVTHRDLGTAMTGMPVCRAHVSLLGMSRAAQPKPYQLAVAEA
jgi:hypothetical protein